MAWDCNGRPGHGQRVTAEQAETLRQDVQLQDTPIDGAVRRSYAPKGQGMAGGTGW